MSELLKPLQEWERQEKMKTPIFFRPEERKFIDD
jgi:hypothetical protein